MTQENYIGHRLSGPWLKGKLLERRKRFLCDVELQNGSQIVAHLADRGRLEDIMIPGATVYVSHQPSPTRKTEYSLVMVDTASTSKRASGQVTVCVDPAGANRLVEELLRRRLIRPWTRAQSWRREVSYGRSRFDFEIELPNQRSCLLEVKSVVAARNSTGLFPDAPSERARRHCEELSELTRSGRETAVVLVAQRADITKIEPHPVDPEFRVVLSEAKQSGVKILGIGFSVSTHGFHYMGRLPVRGI